MKLDEIAAIGLDIKAATEAYEQKGNRLEGGCIWTSKDLAQDVQAIIHRKLPHLASKSLTIRIGNYWSGGEPAFDEVLCLRTVSSLSQVNVRAINAPYHTWLEFDSTIIDLTFLYSNLPERSWKGMKAQPIYHTLEDGLLPYDLPLEYEPLARFACSGHRLPDQDVDVITTPSGGGEEGLYLAGGVEKPGRHWAKLLLDFVINRVRH